ncbi:MAG: hypothetical protein R3B45_16205 [Bdellovibrionota bacterium]
MISVRCSTKLALTLLILMAGCGDAIKKGKNVGSKLLVENTERHSSHYCNGQERSDNWGTYYPNGQKVSDNWGTYYPNGQKVSDNWETYYPNGQKVSDNWGTYYPNGQKVSDNWGTYYPNGQKVSDNQGCYYPNGLERECQNYFKVKTKSNSNGYATFYLNVSEGSLKRNMTFNDYSVENLETEFLVSLFSEDVRIFNIDAYCDYIDPN